MNTENRTIPVAVNGHAPHASAEGAAPSAAPRQSFTPLIDIHEGPDGLILEADVPGVTENDVSIQLEDNVLNLMARGTATAPEHGRLLHEEYRHGDFVRAFILSDEVDRSKITAELRNGLLRLTLPKADRVKTRRIEIKA